MELLNAKPRSGFVAPYKWDESRICMIKHQHGGFLRANPKNHQECNYKGGQTDWSKWKIYLHDNAQIIQIQNLKTKKYLEIDKHGQFVTVSNEGGASSKFRLHRHPNNLLANSLDHKDNDNDEEEEESATHKEKEEEVIMNGNHANDDDSKSKPLNQALTTEDGVVLESLRNIGLYLSVHPNDGVYISREYSNAHNLLYFLVEGKKDEGLFKKPYLLKQQNTIIISHAFGGSIRVNPKNETQVDSKGDKDILSQWEALPNDNASILQFRNVKSGSFLRIVDGSVSCCEAKSDPNAKFKVHVVQSPNIVKLESASFEGQFISVRQKGLCIGNGGPHCQMTLYRKE